MKRPVLSARLRKVVVALVVLGAGLLALRSRPLAPVPEVRTVVIARQARHPIRFGIGVVESRRTVLVGPTAAGRVVRVHVEQGDTVRAGQLLAEMDPVDLEERLTASRHGLARARAGLAAAEAQGREAESRLATAAANARRYQALRQSGFVSAEAERARGHESRAAEAGLQGSRAGVAAARADGERLLSETRALERQLANTRLIAPVGGRIVSRDFEAGSTVLAGQAVLRMTEADALWLRVRIDQGRSAGLAPGLGAAITLRSRPGEHFAGKVARVEQMSDAVTEERVAMVAFDAPPAGLTLNEMAEVTLQLPARPAVLAVPPAALVRQMGQVGVFVVAEGRARFRPLRVGLRTEQGVEVSDGLEAGDTVIVRTPKPLSDGDRVRADRAGGAPA